MLQTVMNDYEVFKNSDQFLIVFGQFISFFGFREIQVGSEKSECRALAMILVEELSRVISLNRTLRKWGSLLLSTWME